MSSMALTQGFLRFGITGILDPDMFCPSGLCTADTRGPITSMYLKVDEFGGGSSKKLAEKTAGQSNEQNLTGPFKALLAGIFPLFADNICAELPTDKWTSHIVPNGKSAVSAIQTVNPDVVVIRPNLSDIGGLEFLKTVQEKSPYLPIIMLGDDKDAETVLSYIRAGAFDYVVTTPTFLEMLLEQMGHAALRHRTVLKNKQLLKDATETVAKLTRAQEALKHHHDAAIEANHAKSAFLASMSHELRTPLNAILGYAHILKEDAEENGQQDIYKDASKIINAGAHLLSLINEILDLARIESGEIKIEPTEFPLRDLLKNIIETMAPVAEENENQLELELSPDLQSMTSDRQRLTQCLYNLIGNACKFTKEGTVKLIVKPSDSDANKIEFHVQDTGIGMTQEECDRVFEAFIQANDQTQQNYGGTGLGLAITYELVQVLGGRIWVESQEGKGTTFKMILPKTISK